MGKRSATTGRYTHPPAPTPPPAGRSAEVQTKASCQDDQAGQPYRGFGGLPDHLATLTRNQVRFAGASAEVLMLAEATADQRHASS